MNKKSLAVFELIFAGLIWGSSFTAAKWCLESFSVQSLLLLRFATALVIGVVIYAIFRPKDFKSLWWFEFKNAWIVGLCLGLTLWLQTYGLKFTSATKSSFITSLYVVLIPITMQFFFRSHVKEKLGLASYGTALLALVGMFLLVDPSGNEFNKGDIITFFCAVAASFHIIYTGWRSKRSQSPFLMNTFQSFWCFVSILPLSLLEDHPLRAENVNMKVVIGFLILTIGCTLIGFLLQVRAQRVLSTQVTSMLCLLEGPFASLFAFTLGAEHLSSKQLTGAAVILIASYLAVWFEPEETTIQPAQ